jgi:alpha-glucoside transport system substrate-binding protein
VIAAVCDDDDADGGEQGATTTEAEQIGGSVEVLAKWTGVEFDAAREVMHAFDDETGIKVDLQGVGDDLPTILTTRIEGGDPPDVAQLPQPGLLTNLAERGELKPIEDLVGDTVDQSYAEIWREMGSHGGTLYGVWFKVANKSTVWYSVSVLEDNGLEPPETWDEWVRLRRAT